MKIKFSLAATAAALVLTSVSASATINVSSTPDLLFFAYDSLTGASYVRDLGVSLSALSTSQTFNAPTGSIFTAQMAPAVNAGDPIQWDVVALNNTNGSQTIYTTGDITQMQGLANQDVTALSGSETAELGGFTQLDNPTNLYAKANGEYTGSQSASDQTNGTVLANNFGFGFPVSGNGVGTSMNFLQVANNGTVTQLYTNSSLAAFNNNAKGGYFTLVDGNGDLTWTNVAAVPLPGTAMLLVPGLLALFGLGMRRNQTGV